MAVFRKLLSTERHGNTDATTTANSGNGGGTISTERPPRGPRSRLGLLSLDGGAGAMTPFRSSRRRRESVVADVTVKILLMGKHGCGKTSLVRQWVDASFDTGQLPTVGADRFVKYIMDDTTRKNIKVEVWDASGRTACESTVAGYARAQDGVMVVYDVTNQTSFDRVAHLLEAARAQNPAGPSSSAASQPRAILRTRSSLKDARPERTCSNSAASDKLDTAAAVIARSNSSVSATTACEPGGTGSRRRRHLSSLSSFTNIFSPSSSASTPDRTILRKSRSSDASYSTRSDASTGVSPPLAVVVVGNRTDLTLSRAVEADVAKRQSSQWQAPVVETSARNPRSVNQAFMTLVAEVLLQRGLATQDTNLVRLALRLLPMPAYVCDDLTTGKAVQGPAAPLDIAYAHRAAVHGSIEALHMMMAPSVHTASDAKGTVDVRDGRGCTPLHVAAAAGHMLTVKRLLREGAGVFALDHDDLAPAEVATDCKVRDYLQKVAARVEHDECRVLGERPLTTASVIIVGSDAQSVLAVHSLLTEAPTPSFPSPHQPLHHSLPLSSLSLQPPSTDIHAHTYTHIRTPTHTTPASNPTHTPAHTPTRTPRTPKSVFGSMTSGVRRGFENWSTPRRKSATKGGGGGGCCEHEGHGGAADISEGLNGGRGTGGGSGGGGAAGGGSGSGCDGLVVSGQAAPTDDPSGQADHGIMGRSAVRTAPHHTERYEFEERGSTKEKEEVTCVALLQRVHRSRASDGSEGGGGGREGEEEDEDGDFCGLMRPSDVRVHEQCASDLRVRVTTWSPDATPWALQLLPAPPATVYVVAMDMSSPDLTTTRQILDMIHAVGTSKQGENDILIVGTYPEATEQPSHVLSRSAAQRLMGTAGKGHAWTRVMEWPHAGSKSAACTPPVVLPVPAEPTQGPSTDLARHLLRQGVSHAVRELTVLRQDHPFLFLLLQREIHASPSALLPLSALRQLADSIATTYTRQPRMHPAALMAALDFLTTTTMDLLAPPDVSRKGVMAMLCGENAERQRHNRRRDEVAYVRSDAGARLLSLLMEALPAAAACPFSNIRSAAHTLLSTGSLPREQLLQLINSTLPPSQSPPPTEASTTPTPTTTTTTSAEPTGPPSATDDTGGQPPASQPGESASGSVERLTGSDMMAGLLALERMDLALCMDDGRVLMPHLALQRQMDPHVARRTQLHPRSTTPAHDTRTHNADDTCLTCTYTTKQLVCVYDFPLGLPPSLLARALVRGARVSVLRYHGFCVSAPVLCDAGALAVVGHGNGEGRDSGAIPGGDCGDGGNDGVDRGGGGGGAVRKHAEGVGNDSGYDIHERAAVACSRHVTDGDGGVWIDGPGYHLLLQQDLDKGRIALYACVDNRGTPTHPTTTTSPHTHTVTPPHSPHTCVLPPAVASRVGLTVHAILEDTRRAYFPRRRMSLGLPADGEGESMYDLVEVLLAAKMRERRGEEEGEEEEDSGSGGAVSHTGDEAEHALSGSGGGDSHTVDSTNDVQSIALDAYLSWATTQAAMPQSTFRPLPRLRTHRQSHTMARHGDTSSSAAAKRSPLGVLSRGLSRIGGNGVLLDSRRKRLSVEGRCGATGAGETVSDTSTHAREDVMEGDPWATDVVATLRVSIPSTSRAQHNAGPHGSNSHRRTFNLIVTQGGTLAVCDTAEGQVWILESVGPGKDGFRLRSGEAKRGYLVVGEWGTSDRVRLAVDAEVCRKNAAVFIARVDENGGSKLTVVGRKGDGELSTWEVVVGEGRKEVTVAVTEKERSRASVDRCMWTLGEFGATNIMLHPIIHDASPPKAQC